MIIHPCSAPLEYLRNPSSNLDPMSYVLTYPNSQLGWQRGIQLQQHSVGGQHEISTRGFYAYKLAICASFNPVLESFRLTHQYAMGNGSRLNTKGFCVSGRTRGTCKWIVTEDCLTMFNKFKTFKLNKMEVILQQAS